MASRHETPSRTDGLQCCVIERVEAGRIRDFGALDGPVGADQHPHCDGALLLPSACNSRIDGRRIAAVVGVRGRVRVASAVAAGGGARACSCSGARAAVSGNGGSGIGASRVAMRRGWGVVRRCGRSRLRDCMHRRETWLVRRGERHRRGRRACRAHRGRSGRGGARAAASGDTIRAFDQIGQHPLAMHSRARRGEAQDQPDDSGMSGDRSRERREMTPRRRRCRLIQRMRFVFVFQVARPRLRELKMEWPGAMGDCAAGNLRHQSLKRLLKPPSPAKVLTAPSIRQVA